MIPRRAPRGRFESLALCAFIGSLLVAIYGLTYSGTFTSDDEHIFVSKAQSLARHGDFEARAAYGNSRLRWLEALPDYRDVEPVQAVLGSLLVRWAHAAGLGAVQALFLMNVFVTAATACVVFSLVLAQGFRPAIATLTALAYGTGTMAWPYAKTYFRDPLAALMLALALACFEFALPGHRSLKGKLAGWGLTAGFLIAGVLVKSTVAVAVLVLPLAAVIRPWRRGAPWRDLALPLTAGLGIVAAGVGLSLAAPPSGPLSRISWPHLSFLLDFFLHAPRHAFWEAVLGPLVSPGKSVFLYSPILLLAVASLALDWRKRWRSMFVPWAVLFGLILLQALFYDDEWWGQTNWGLRFLLPALPPLAVACAPALDRSARWRIVGGVLVVAGILIQIPGLAVSVPGYYGVLAEVQRENAWTLALWQPYHSAILGHWRMLLNGAALNFAWARLWAADPIRVGLIAAGWLTLLCASAGGIFRSLTGSPARRSWLGLLSVALALTAVLPPFAMMVYRLDPAHHADRTAYRSAAALVSSLGSEGDAVLIQGYGSALWGFYLNQSHSPQDWYALPLHFPSPKELDQVLSTGDAAHGLDPSAVALFRGLSSEYRRAWLIAASDGPPGNLALEERWLTANYQAMGEWEYEGQARVTLYSLIGAAR